MAYTWEWLCDLPRDRRDALMGFESDDDTMISTEDFGNIAIAAANDECTMKEWLGIAIDIYLTDFEERHPGLLLKRTRYQ